MSASPGHGKVELEEPATPYEARRDNKIQDNKTTQPRRKATTQQLVEPGPSSPHSMERRSELCSHHYFTIEISTAPGNNKTTRQQDTRQQDKATQTQGNKGQCTRDNRRNKQGTQCQAT